MSLARKLNDMGNKTIMIRLFLILVMGASGCRGIKPVHADNITVKPIAYTVPYSGLKASAGALKLQIPVRSAQIEKVQKVIADSTVLKLTQVVADQEKRYSLLQDRAILNNDRWHQRELFWDSILHVKDIAILHARDTIKQKDGVIQGLKSEGILKDNDNSALRAFKFWTPFVGGTLLLLAGLFGFGEGRRSVFKTFNNPSL